MSTSSDFERRLAMLENAFNVITPTVETLRETVAQQAQSTENGSSKKKDTVKSRFERYFGKEEYQEIRVMKI